MLVLTRNVGERTVIKTPSGEVITVIVAAIRSGDKIRLAFDAPQDVSVHRQEIQDRIDKEGPHDEARRLHDSTDGVTSAVRQSASNDASEVEADRQTDQPGCQATS